MFVLNILSKFYTLFNTCIDLWLSVSMALKIHFNSPLKCESWDPLDFGQKIDTFVGMFVYLTSFEG